jgi:hypothetical protein
MTTLEGKEQIHPLLQDNAIFPTRALEEFINTLRYWLMNLLPGGIVYGNQRTGKTQALRYLINNIQTSLGEDIPAIILSAWEPTATSTTENRFFGELLYALGYAIPNSGTAAIKRRRAIDFIIGKTRDKKEHRYLLIIDEAQWLSSSQLRYLMDIHNQLKFANIRLITILVGQPELLMMKNDLRTRKERHLLGRFMTDSHEFHGLQNLNDLKRIMHSLDNDSEFPIGSGCSYTQFFAPLAYQRGWRVEQDADLTWRVLNEMLASQGITTAGPGFPMQPFTAYFIWLFRTIQQMDSPEFTLTEGLIERGLLQVAIQFQDLG